MCCEIVKIAVENKKAELNTLMKHKEYTLNRGQTIWEGIKRMSEWFWELKFP